MPLFDKEVLEFAFFLLLVFEFALGLQFIVVFFMNSIYFSWTRLTRRCLKFSFCLFTFILFCF